MGFGATGSGGSGSYDFAYTGCTVGTDGLCYPDVGTLCGSQAVGVTVTDRVLGTLCGSSSDGMTYTTVTTVTATR